MLCFAIYIEVWIWIYMCLKGSIFILYPSEKRQSIKYCPCLSFGSSFWNYYLTILYISYQGNLLWQLTASGKMPADFLDQLWLGFFKLNLIAVKLVQEEAIFDLLLSYHAVPSVVLYYFLCVLFLIIIRQSSDIFFSVSTNFIEPKLCIAVHWIINR